MSVPAHWPVLGVCGYSGSGKTTLITQLVPRLTARGLCVAVVKHDAHGLAVDTPGKDTDRLFAAGATVFAHDPGQTFLRRAGAVDLPAALAHLLRDHDLVLVEGHKDTPLPARVWLSGADGDGVPDTGSFERVLERAVDRPAVVEDLLDGWLADQVRRRPLRAGLLVGGGSSRMGRPKALLQHGGRTWADRVADALAAHAPEVVLLGDGPVPGMLADRPRLPDAPDAAGPLAGLRAALRWDPTAAWLVAACDMPLLTGEALGWLLDQRRPGAWAVIPQRSGGGPPEPLAAWYDPRMGAVLERSRRPREAADHAKAHGPVLPPALAPLWRSFNTPEDLADLG